MSARVETESAFRVRGRDALFSAAGYYSHPNFAQYDISPSGDRFVLLRTTGDAGTGLLDDLVIVTNWFQELRERMGSN